MEKAGLVKDSNSLPVSEREKIFFDRYPEYSNTALLDQLRAVDYTLRRWAGHSGRHKTKYLCLVFYHKRNG